MLVAEIIVGELARAAGLAMPEIVLIELDADLARAEPDAEIQQLMRASAGLNLAFDYLPGSVTFDPVADQPDALLASSIVWLDAYTSNVDRTRAQRQHAHVASEAVADRSRRRALFPSRLGRRVRRVRESVSRHQGSRPAEVRGRARRGGCRHDRAHHARAHPARWSRSFPMRGSRRPGVRDAGCGPRGVRRDTYAPPAGAARIFRGGTSVHAQRSYDYAVIRVVPRVERQEFVNAGVIVWCQEQDFLEARLELDEARVRMLDPGADLEAVRRHLASISIICAGGDDSGPIGKLSKRERFDWLVAPRSTIIQTSTVHTGRCDELAAAARTSARRHGAAASRAAIALISRGRIRPQTKRDPSMLR